MAFFPMAYMVCDVLDLSYFLRHLMLERMDKRLTHSAVGEGIDDIGVGDGRYTLLRF